MTIKLVVGYIYERGKKKEKRERKGERPVIYCYLIKDDRFESKNEISFHSRSLLCCLFYIAIFFYHIFFANFLFIYIWVKLGHV